MTNKERYDVPQELIDISLKAEAIGSLGRCYVKMPFGYKKAKKSFINQFKLNNEFWQKVYGLYPQLENRSLRLDAVHKSVFINE